MQAPHAEKWKSSKGRFQACCKITIRPPLTRQKHANSCPPHRSKGLKYTDKEASEAQRDLEHSVGLGHKPNQVPEGTPDINGELRTIMLGWHVSIHLLTVLLGCAGMLICFV